MNQFVPVFPRSVSGGNFRCPLRLPFIERIAQTMDDLYRVGSLTELERGFLLREYPMLVTADETLYLAAKNPSNRGAFKFLLGEIVISSKNLKHLDNVNSPAFSFLTRFEKQVNCLYDDCRLIARKYRVPMCLPPFSSNDEF